MAKTPSTAPKSEQLCEWVGIAIFLASAFAWVALATHDPGDWGGMMYPPNSEIVNKGSKAGAAFAWFMFLHFGIGAFLIATLTSIWGGAMFLRKKTTDPFFKFFGAAIVVLSASTLASLATPAIAQGSRWHNTMTSMGGLYGEALARILSDNLGTVGAVMAVLFALASSALIATDWVLLSFFLRGSQALEGSFDATWGKVAWGKLFDSARGLLNRRRQALAAAAVPAPAPKREFKPVMGEVVREEAPVTGETVDVPMPEPVAVPAPAPAPVAKVESKPEPKRKDVIHKPNPELPPITLLEDVEIEEIEIDQEGRVLALTRALESFEVSARVVDYQAGPVVTMYELELCPGTRVGKIIGLSPDLSIHLGVPTLRVVYPLPGKTTIGIEVPNPRSAAVRLRNLIVQTEDSWRKMHLPLFFGQGATGLPVIYDLQDMPHLLVAGTTGSGKSVCLTTMILSMLLTRTSEDLKLILVDPKQVEMAMFKEIPHLMAPVVTDMRRAPMVLEWLVAQMEERYSLFAKVGVKKIEQFNKLGDKAILEKLTIEGEEPPDVETHLPYIVVIIDELADLMMVSAKEVEATIQRLSQKSRAVGIHLVLATQRPSVDVITGLIKSNMPSRIAFKVAANVDSRTILDQPGAEKLLGKGDMLLMINGCQQLMRAQCTWIPDEESKNVITWLHEKGGAATFDPTLTQVAESAGDSADGTAGCDDEFFERAAEVIIGEQRGSVSLLQRKLEIGFSRAGKLMDALERAGIVGPQVGAKAREVRLTLPAWQARHVSSADRETAEAGSTTA
ncbi:MAG: DNA segregation ATPase FtsK/SpoIIIE S-DNA-T [Planctomycetota bacterium]|nr:MAG: DNA segregation ATPase FtsK/SpoIIIE S-DNA-T [Planctomycetota bacterium]